jgi:hypothetical protein
MGMNVRGRTLAVVVAGVLAASSTAATGSAGNHRAIPPGDWTGIISFFGDTGTARGEFEGTFKLQAAGGAASGGFGWEGVVSTDAAGDVLVTIVGEISGDTTSPLLSLTGGTSGGIAIPDPEGSGNLVLTNTSCASIEGIGANFTTRAQISDSEWLAVRSGAPIASGTFFADLRELRLRAIEVERLIGMRDASVLTAELVQLVADANLLLTEIHRTPECQAFHFRSFVASSVERLVRAVLEDPAIAGAAEFTRLIVLSLSAGTWGPSATDPDALDLEVAILEDFIRRVDEAIAAEDAPSLTALGSLAFLLGFTDIEARITEALAGLGP